MKTHILDILSERSFLNLWFGEIFTVLSSNIFNFFLVLFVFNETHSNTAVSGIVLSFTIPSIIFGVLAGVYVDRKNKKRVIIVTNLLRALLVILLALSLHNLVLVYLLSFVISILTQFFIPAETPIIPLVVHKKNLLSANALFGMAIYGSTLIAYILSGPMLIYLKSINTLIILAIMLVIGAIFVSFIKLTYAKPKPVHESIEPLNIIKDLRHTMRLVSQTRQIFSSLSLLALSQTLILIFATIAPGYANQVLGIHVEEFPVLFVAPAALGMVIGAITLTNIFHNRSREKTITLGLFLSGLSLVLMPFGSRVASKAFIQTLNAALPHVLEFNILHFMVVLAFILGFSNALVFVPANTTLQEKTTEEFRGKIYGFLNTAVGLLSLFPIIIVGGLADIIGVSNVLTGIGIALFLIGTVRLFD